MNDNVKPDFFKVKAHPRSILAQWIPWAAENITDLNNIPTPCPHYKSKFCSCSLWGSRTLGRSFQDKILDNPSDNADMSNEKG